MTTDTTEKGLERLICIAMAGHACEPAQGGAVAERPANYGVGWIGGDPQDYDREYCIDLAQLSAFLHDTQPVAAEPLDLGQGSPTRRKFLARLQGEVAKRGTIDVLRKGVKHGPHQIDRGYVNRCVNDIRRRPSQPLIQWRFHPHTVHRDRRLRSTQGPSDA